MKCVNFRLNGELIQFGCLNCRLTCSLANSCNSFFKITLNEELDLLKN